MRSDVPIFAICLGHQLMALAPGRRPIRLKYGHRGGNHPVKDLRPEEFTFPPRTTATRWMRTPWIRRWPGPAFVNVNDGTNEGLSYTGKNIFTVQFHPEACPGPQDSGYLFDRFMDMMEGANNARKKDIKKVLVIGSGPIVIGQAAEFDYAGTQACRSLKEEGMEVVLLKFQPGHHHDRQGYRGPGIH